MRISIGVAALFGAILLSACGNPRAGDDCSTTGLFCLDQTAAAECKVGTWTALPCRGPQGCVENDTVSCDMSHNREGDACASSTEGKGICTADGKATLECRQGKFVKTNTCGSCVVEANQIVCKP